MINRIDLKKMFQIYAIHKGHILIQTQKQVETERMKEDKSKQKRDLVAMLLSDKIYFKSKSVTRDKMVLYTDIGIIHQEARILIVIHEPPKFPKYMKKTLAEFKGEILNFIIIIKQFIKIILIMDRISRQKIHEEAVNNSIDQVDILDKYRTFNTIAENALFSSAH